MASTRDTINDALDKVFNVLDETSKVIRQTRNQLGGETADKATDAIQRAASEMRVARNAIRFTELNE